MKRCKTHLVCVCLFFLAVVPAYCQRGTFGVDVGETTDRFGALPSFTGAEANIEGQVAILKQNMKTGRPAIVAGGEIRLPTDTANHAKEYAIFGGAEFQMHNLTVGVDGQVRKVYLPASVVDNQFFVRYKMELLELPIVFRYKFGTSKRAFIEAKGAPEFSPRWRSAGSLAPLPNPRFDHGYFIQGSAGYNFGKWYAKATYETRYFKFVPDLGNPNGLYNWRSTMVTGGVGFSF
jgi:hypothetical protein